MIEQELVSVKFYTTDSTVIECDTDKKTADEIAIYNEAYNNIDGFVIKSQLSNDKKNKPFIYEEFAARSEKYTIAGTKKYIPNVPLTLSGVQYQSGVLCNENKKFTAFSDGVASLFHELFYGR